MVQLKQQLAQHPFLQDLAPEQLALLTEHGSEVTFKSGQYIFQQGEAANKLYLLLEGRVALDTFVANHGLVTVQTIGEGEILGWSWFIPPHRWRFNALTVAPTKAIAIDGDFLRARFEDDCALGYAMAKRLAIVIGKRFAGLSSRLR